MDTKLTKKYTIIFLLILNLFLLGANFIVKEKYTLSKEKEVAIIEHINKNDIYLNTKLPKKYVPMLEISMLRQTHDKDFLKNVFFGKESGVDKVHQDKDTIFYKGERILIINDRYVLFKDKTYDESIVYSEKEVKKIAKKYADDFSKQYGKMYIDNIIQNDGYFSVSYIQNIEGYKVFNNVLSIKIYNGGGLEVYFSNYKKSANISYKRSIYSSDEAIYAFSREIKKLIPDKNIYISSMELGYYLREIEDSIYFSLIPYYRIYVEENEIPFYINAYTNELEYGIDAMTLTRGI